MLLILTKAEKRRWQLNHLCLYCGALGHIMINFPHPHKQVNQENAKVDLDSLVTSSHPSTC